MNYRSLGKSGIMVSEIGLGCEHLQGMEYDAIKEVIDTAIENGVNILDIFMSEPQVRSDIGKALEGAREKVVLQGHIGAAWVDGQYKKTRDLDECKLFFEDFMTRLQTDYVDIGMLHFVDKVEEVDEIFGGDIIKYALELKRKGKIKLIGMSCHEPIAALKAVKTGLVDVLMFSVNPAYDLLHETTDIDQLFDPQSFNSSSINGINPVRDELYKTCEAMGVAITVMKGLGAGALLNGKASPFGEALTVSQCIHYGLTRPAVASILIGSRKKEEVIASLSYLTANDKEKDYSLVLANTPKYSLKEKCMYCNHCLPCPAHIDIAKVTKYLDLTEMTGEANDSVKDHYLSMENKASNCIECGNCEKNCPFEVKIIENMRKAKAVFGA